jgi:Putative adhesin/Domain of unknown function (DUF5668)
MGSTVEVPPPVPPPLRPRRSMAGAVVLIIMGIIFLMGTMGMLQWHMLGHWFARYWPLLIILWGVVKLVEHQQAQRTGTRASGIGAGGVFLLIFLIGSGLIATQASRFNWDELRDQFDKHNDFPMFGHTYSYDDQLAQEFPSGASLHVVNDRGAVNVTVSDDGQLHVAAHKRINSENQQDADKWNTQTKPLVAVSGNTVTVNSNTQGAGEHWVSSDLDISIPRKASAAVVARHGDVSVLGRQGDVDVNSQHGDVSVSDIAGKVSLNLDDSSARVAQVTSDVSVQGRANDVSIEDVKGSATLNGDFKESLKLAKIGKAVSFKSSRTGMEFAHLDGDLNLDSGDLQATNVAGPSRLETRSKDIRLTGISGDLHLQNENGAVEIHVGKIGSIQVQNRQGDIQIYLPEKAGFQLEAHARNGEIESDYSELKVNNSDDEATATGTVGGGGATLTVNNEHGTIEIRKGAAMAQAPRAPSSPKSPPQPPEPPQESDN